MKTHRIIVLATAVILASLAISGCGKSEKERLEEIGEQISFEYHADLRLTREEGKGFVLKTAEIFDFAKRPSEGNEIVGIMFDDRNKSINVLGTDNYTKEKDEGEQYPRIMLGREQEILVNQAGRFRIRFTSEKTIESEGSGIFRRKFTFEPTEVWPLVEDNNPKGYSQIDRKDPDYGDIKLATTATFGNKQPPGGSRSRDRRSMVYNFPTDLTELGALTFTYFPSRFGYYFGGALMWTINRLAWMILGIVLYVWWKRRKEKIAKRKAEQKLKPKETKFVKKIPPPPEKGPDKDKEKPK